MIAALLSLLLSAEPVRLTIEPDIQKLELTPINGAATDLTGLNTLAGAATTHGARSTMTSVRYLVISSKGKTACICDGTQVGFRDGVQELELGDYPEDLMLVK